VISLPDHRNSVFSQMGIFADQRELILERLRHQDAVKWILVDSGKAPQREHVSNANGECRNTGPDDVFLPPGERVGQESAGFARFEDQLPEIGNARCKWGGSQGRSRLRTQRLRIGESPDEGVRIGEDQSPALQPIVRFGITHGLPPVVARGDQWFFAGNSKRKGARPARGYQLGHRLAVAGNDNGFPLLDQFQEAGEPGLGFMNVDLHGDQLSSFA
jgi:hypothetical protein